MQKVLMLAALLCVSGLAEAAPQEVDKDAVRPIGRPMAVGELHSLRIIPEACSLVRGQFTGNRAQPYQVEVVRSSEHCNPRALVVDASQAKPSAETGWKFNDLIRIPSAACPSQLAVLRVWHHPGKVAPPSLDAQGRSRIYLQDMMNSGQSPDLPKFALDFQVEGKACR